MDSILHLQLKSKWGGKALDGCLKLLSKLTCQLQFFALVGTSKKTKRKKKTAKERLFSWAACHTVISEMRVWKPGSIAGITQASSPSSSQLALGDWHKQNTSHWFGPTPCCLSNPLSHFPAVCVNNVSSFIFLFRNMVSHLLFHFSLFSHLTYSSKQHNRAWTAVSSHQVLLGVFKFDWHVVVALLTAD